MNDSDEIYYKRLRERCYRLSEQIIKSSDTYNISLSEIDSNAINASMRFGYTWAWDDDENIDLPSRFEVAVWLNKNRLISLCRGKPTYDHQNLCLEIIEAAPKVPFNERPSVLPIVDATAEVYARLIGAAEIRLMEPTSESRVKLYKRYGYHYNGIFLYRRI